MIGALLIRTFVPDASHPELPRVRFAYGMLSGGAGVAVNVLLFAVKIWIGTFSGSIAVCADAVNNLSDAGSSLVTLFGFKLASKPPDNDHPFGHGRLEYIAGLIVAVLIVAAGLNFLKESVWRIFRPGELKVENLMLYLILGSMLLKVWLFFFYRRIGKLIRSETVLAAAFDSLSDLAVTAVVAAALFAERYTSFPVDGCAGTLVAALITVGGCNVLRRTVSPLLGELPDGEMVKRLRDCLLKCPGICGVHDIIIHSYGSNLYFATAHAEVKRDGDLLAMHDILEAAEVEVGKTMPVKLVLHCDPYDTEDERVKLWRSRCENAVSAFDCKFKMYDFRLIEEEGKPREVHFHLLIPRDYALGGDEIRETLRKKVREYDPEIVLNIEFVNAYVSE